MKNYKILIGLAVMLLIGVGCSQSMYKSRGYSTDDLYGVHSKTDIAYNKKAKAEARRAQAEAEEAEWNAKIAEAEAHAAENKYESYMEDTYDGAYARRINGFSSPSYKMPSSYFNFRYTEAFNYVTAYDPAFYNVVVMGDQVWVEPQYISSMFGNWGTSMYAGGWYNGWQIGPRYSWYGHNHLSWWDWNYNVCYNPWYGHGWGGHYPGWGGGHYPGWGGGHYPSWGGGHPGHGGSVHDRDIVRRTPAYRSPTSGRDFGNRNSGGIVSRGSKGTRPAFGVRGSSSSNRGSSTVTKGSSSSGTRNSNRGGTSQYRGGSTNRGTSYDRGSSSSSNNNTYTPSSPSTRPSSGSSGSSGSRYSGGSNRGGGATGRNAGGR